MKFEADLKNLPPMLESLRGYVKRPQFNNYEINKIQLAVEEILVNIIKYAYPDKNGNIEINCSSKEGRGLVIEITDWGIPFDPLKIPGANTRSGLEDRRVGGLGIFFMRKIADRVHYHREQDRNILTITIYKRNM